MFQDGQTLGDFEILGRLGQGGMGAVYKARQVSLKRFVALKTLQGAIASDPEYIARFHREAIAAAGLNHPNLVQVYAAGENDGLHWFAMEYVEGESAQDRMKRKQRLDPAEAIAIAIHIATALDYAWRKAQLIHRDIKPDNIFLSSDGEVKLGDLGLAKSAGEDQSLTTTGASMGTPHYVSPEQGQGRKDVDLRADIYSLGCTLFHLVAGRTPYRGETAMSVMLQHVTEPVPDPQQVWPGFPGALVRVVVKMMAKNPAERQQTYAEVIADLRGAHDALTGATVVSKVAVTQQPASPPSRRKPVAALLGGLALLLALGALFHFAPWKKGDGLTEAERAAKERAVQNSAPNSSGATAPATTTLESGAIKLWDSADKVPAKAGVAWEDGAMKLRRAAVFHDKPLSKNLIVRASIRMNPDAFQPMIQFRRVSRTRDDSDTYRVLINPALQQVSLGLTQGGKNQELGRWDLPRKYSPEEWVKVEARAIDDELTVSVDGQTLGTVRNSALPQPGLIAVFADTNGYFRDIVYVPLDKAGAATTAAGALEPGAIRLFDTPESVSLKNGGAKLQDGVLVLGGANGGYVYYWKTLSRDAIFRASVRTTPQLKNFGMRVRDPGSKSTDPFYLLGAGPGAKEVVLYHGVGAQLTRIKAWPLPRTYGASDWLPLEVHVIGEEFTVYADGQKLGTVQDSRLLKPGGVGLYADHAEVRDIVYVPLDQAIAATSAAAPLEPGAIKLWDAPEKIPTKPGMSWEDNALKLTRSVAFFENPRSRNLRLSASIRANADLREPMFHLRRRSMGTESYYYRVSVHPTIRLAQLEVVQGSTAKTLQEWQLPRAYGSHEWLRFEVQAIDDSFTVSIDGKPLGTVRDSTITDAGTIAVYANENGYFRDIVYVPLDKAGTTLAPAPTNEAWRDWIAEKRAEQKLAGFGFEDDGTFVRSPNSTAASWKPISRDGAIRAIWKLSSEVPLIGQTEPSISLRKESPDTGTNVSYTATIGAKAARLDLHTWEAGRKVDRRELGRWPLPVGYDRTQEHNFEFRAVGDLLTISLNGQPLGTVRDSSAQEGGFGFTPAKGDSIRKVEYLSLDPPAGASSSANSTPAAATKDAPFVNTLGMKFVPVPITGGPTGGQRVLFSVWETRVQDYEVFATEKKLEWKKPPFEQGPTHPAVFVSWDEAAAFGEWLTERERKAGKLGATDVYRLPTDHEWSCAVGIGEREDPKLQPSAKSKALADEFPWGTAWPPPTGAGNYSGEEAAGSTGARKDQEILRGYRDAFIYTAPVGSFPANRLGLHDLGGNVWEHTRELVRKATEQPIRRGGNFTDSAPESMRSSIRAGVAVDGRGPYAGFRIVLTPAFP